ncbi:UDP-glycosyltransferase 71K1-like [Coffea arabica]|uniref:UDP-glycosyltransferase 71K1-like n=1 Tax=Coffea arabica TaxID=13443 RepID=A0ABM4UQS2_COFAR
MKWLDDQPPLPVVFLCFESLGSFEPDQLAHIANALEQSGYRFLWSVRSPIPKGFTYGTAECSNFSEILPEGFLESVENRGLVCAWAPQIEVLAHEAVGELEPAMELKLDYRMQNAKNLVMAEEIEKAIRCLMDNENPITKRVKEM